MIVYWYIIKGFCGICNDIDKGYYRFICVLLECVCFYVNFLNGDL